MDTTRVCKNWYILDNYKVSQNIGIDKNFNSDLLITLIHSFLISLDLVGLKVCLIYHLLFLLVRMRFSSSFLVHVRLSTYQNLCNSVVLELSILGLPSLKKLCLDEFSPNSTVLFLNSK